MIQIIAATTIILAIGSALGFIAGYHHCRLTLFSFIDKKIDLKLEVFKHELIAEFDIIKWEKSDLLFEEDNKLTWENLDERDASDYPNCLVDHTTSANEKYTQDERSAREEKPEPEKS